MAELDVSVEGWLPTDFGDPEVRAATGNLRIVAGEGDGRVVVTEVEDKLAQTVRSHIRVPVVPLAEWLLMNWWRLRWEGRPQEPSLAWYEAHQLSAISGEDPWPPLEISSDGEFVNLHMEAVSGPVPATIRYLQSVNLEVTATAFEAAVERLVDCVEGRLGATGTDYSDLTELRKELREERKSPSTARACRWQARAGFDPGEAPDGWLQHIQAIVDDVGDNAGEELLSSLPDLDGGLEAAVELLAAMKQSPTAVDLEWVTPSSTLRTATGERPWQKGARLAQALRKQHGWGTDTLENGTLADTISAPVPLQGEIVRDSALGGGMPQPSPRHPHPQRRQNPPHHHLPVDLGDPPGVVRREAQGAGSKASRQQRKPVL